MNLLVGLYWRPLAVGEWVVELHMGVGLPLHMLAQVALGGPSELVLPLGTEYSAKPTHHHLYSAPFAKPKGNESCTTGTIFWMSNKTEAK